MQISPIIHGVASKLSVLAAALQRTWRRRTPHGDVCTLLGSMERCRTALAAFGRDSDHEFTALAQGLAGLNERLAELQAQTASLRTVLEDRDEERAISSAYSLYRDAVNLVHASAGIAVTAQDQLSQIETALVDNCRDRDVFERDHSYLRFITLSIRIEASRLPSEAQSVFLNVASAISETGEKIQTCTATAFAQIEAVISDSKSARREIIAAQEALHGKARQSIETVQRELNALSSALAPSIRHSGDIARLFESAQPQVLAVTGALQHQDIVRQQLEHVGQGFSDIEDHLHTARSGSGKPRVEWDYVVQASRIQGAQLDASRIEIEHAGRAVVDGVQALLRTTSLMTEQLSMMEGSASQALESCRVADLFSRELRAINTIVEQSQEANTRTAQLLDRIERVVQLFSEEISRYELDVKIVALNAQIAAARLSSADALNRLAEETCRISDESAQVTHRLSEGLKASLRRLDSAKRDDSEFLAIVTRERAAVGEGVALASRKLDTLVARVRSGAADARQAFGPLQNSCRALLDQLRFPTLIDQTFTPATQLCRDLAAQCEHPIREAGPSDSALKRIRQHESRYTMRKEASRHHAVLKGGPTTQPASTEPDDIELFEDPNLGGSIPAGAASVATAEPAASAESKKFGDGIELF